jgi:hypothetical protein
LHKFPFLLQLCAEEIMQTAQISSNAWLKACDSNATDVEAYLPSQDNVRPIGRMQSEIIISSFTVYICLFNFRPKFVVLVRPVVRIEALGIRRGPKIYGLIIMIRGRFGVHPTFEGFEWKGIESFTTEPHWPA